MPAPQAELCNYCGLPMLDPSHCEGCGTSYPKDAKRTSITEGADANRPHNESADPLTEYLNNHE